MAVCISDEILPNFHSSKYIFQQRVITEELQEKWSSKNLIVYVIFSDGA